MCKRYCTAKDTLKIFCADVNSEFHQRVFIRLTPVSYTHLLANAKVAIFGIGGVGGYTAEALARTGIGQLDLIDDDKVCPVSYTHLDVYKRQLHSCPLQSALPLQAVPLYNGYLFLLKILQLRQCAYRLSLIHISGIVNHKQRNSFGNIPCKNQSSQKT